MIGDYIFVRRRRIALSDLYRSQGGGYQYWNGVNWVAVLVYVISVAVSFLFPNWMYTVGLIIAIILYVPLMKKWVLPKFPDSQLDYSFNEQWMK